LTEDATNWRNEVIDERDLVAYIDLMFFMQKNYLSAEEKNEADRLTQERVRRQKKISIYFFSNSKKANCGRMETTGT